MLTLAKKVKKVQGLKRRWLTGSMGPVLVILLLVGVLISVGFASSYYNSARSAPVSYTHLTLPTITSV